MNISIRKRIKHKLIAAFGAVLALSFLLAGWGYYSINKIMNHQNLNQRIDDISIMVLQLRRAEKDFLMRETTNPEFFQTGKSQYLTVINEITQKLQEELSQLKQHPSSGSMELKDSFDAMRKTIEQYSEKLKQIGETVKERGYKDWGLEGELRKAIHEVENTNFPYDRALMLTLRRHEKDFLLRKELVYPEKFNRDVEEFKLSITNAENTDSSAVFQDQQNTILNNLDNYQSTFNQIVEAEMKLGLNEKSGLRGELRAIVHEMEPLIENLEARIRSTTSSIIDNTLLFFLLVFIVQLGAGLVISIRFSNKLTANIKRIKAGIVTLSQGKFPDEVDIASEDELGETQAATNNLVERIKTAADFTLSIGEGRLDQQYDERYKDDVLAKALLDMHQKLKAADEEDEKRNWATKGLADFGEIIRNNENNLRELSHRVISDLVKFVNANQGKLFVLNDEDNNTIGEPHLELYAAYAWKRQKHQNQIISKGEGLSGQAWYEQKSIYLKEVPEDYIKIRSGLGEAVPTSVLIVPLVVNETVFGVIELASLKEFEDYQINFIEKLAEIIAASLSSVKINEKTKSLLEQAQQQSEEMRAQEEEMRQNMEELSATQEEMGRKEKEYLKKIEELESKLAEQPAE
ncbi:GAF domain-containing protein [Fulvivirga ulvae]|uniref:GAF domain-containing protein n=1 Tax=Fulvivirga ulvae TaxID=2904245 RepID=UPI001F19A259|nr:GAF domain-containing protein [Fulvivirga ulvae]UII31235.1 GAF domain-containing protein [Fulvivirga ulvae]